MGYDKLSYEYHPDSAEARMEAEIERLKAEVSEMRGSVRHSEFVRILAENEQLEIALKYYKEHFLTDLPKINDTLRARVEELEAQVKSICNHAHYISRERDELREEVVGLNEENTYLDNCRDDYAQQLGDQQLENMKLLARVEELTGLYGQQLERNDLIGLERDELRGQLNKQIDENLKLFDEKEELTLDVKAAATPEPGHTDLFYVGQLLPLLPALLDRLEVLEHYNGTLIKTCDHMREQRGKEQARLEKLEAVAEAAREVRYDDGKPGTADTLSEALAALEGEG